ncbi:MAG TPA: hypothetical protein VM555_02635 [Tahibacter sp.]|jgi:hypothetical protein|nr:hypothetical protein [Tahibacter sp.]
MNKIAQVAFAFGLSVSSIACALAAPTYLACEFAHPSGKPQVFNFALDEDSGKLGVHVPATGSQRSVDGTYTAGKVTANEGAVAWEIDPAALTVIRDKRMVKEKDRGACKAISAGEAGFEQ